LRHFADPTFWAAYEKLPRQIRELADRNYSLLKQNPQHPSLRLKKVGRFWSVRVGLGYRALAVETTDGLVWFWIGSHSDYDAMIR
jgi:mRNA-degrading endonuclease RelE of RelBE toxin-antitoxin system